MSDSPAFPCNPDRYGDPNEGMSLRDYFAAQVMIGLGTWSPTTYPLGSRKPYLEDVLKARADLAYAQADAMLEARKDR